MCRHRCLLVKQTCHSSQAHDDDDDVDADTAVATEGRRLTELPCQVSRRCRSIEHPHHHYRYHRYRRRNNHHQRHHRTAMY